MASESTDFVARARQRRLSIVGELRARMARRAVVRRLFLRDGALTRDAQQLMDLLTHRARLNKPGFVSDSHHAAFVQGQQDIVLTILTALGDQSAREAALQRELQEFSTPDEE